MKRSPECTTGCGRPFRDGFICNDCVSEIRTALNEIVTFWPELTDVYYRQVTTPSNGSGGTAEAPILFGGHARNAAWSVTNTLSTWIRHMCEERGIERPLAGPDEEGPACQQCLHTLCRRIRETREPFTVRCALWLLRNVAAIQQSEAAAEMHDEIRYAASAILVATVDRPTELRPAGQCSECGGDLRAPMKATTTRCRNESCGHLNDLGERHAQLVDEARHYHATAAVISKQSPFLLGEHLPAERIRLWASRKRLLPAGRDGRGNPTYRVADVQDLHRNYRATGRLVDTPR